MSRQPLAPFSVNAMTVLCKRYLRPKADGRAPCASCGKVHETLEELFDRCTFGNDDFYNLLGSRDFLPNSPTLFNAGTGQGTYSGCFKFDIPDSMEGIMDVATKSAFVQKWGGGVGYCLSDLRPYGAAIRTTHGRACGPIAVLALDHAVSKMITQGGKRAGAQMGILHCDHLDAERFIHCKDVPTDCKCRGCKLVRECEHSATKIFDTFNISIACTDKFMKEASQEGTHAHALFEAIVEGAWSTGDPGIYFIDTAERANETPWLGKLTGTNPCGEVPLLDNEPCNLGSINLGHFVVPPTENNAVPVDWIKLEQVTRLATRYLDAVLDNNSFPDERIKNAAMLTRKLGLGVMGWADMLAICHFHYDSEPAVDLAKEIMKRIQEWSHDESMQLGREKGPCPAFKNCPNDALAQAVPLRRNVTTTCIAPAGTICNIAECSSGIEPHLTLRGERRMGDNTKLLESVRVDTGGFVPHTAHEIDGMWHVKHQAAFQTYTDLAVSKTVNLPHDATKDQIRTIYQQAWKLGCKGITVYRDGSRMVQVVDVQATQPDAELYSTDSQFGLQRHKMAKTANAIRHGFAVGGMEGYLHVGFLPDGKPGEIFITGANQGSTVSGLLSSLAIATSLALQYGVPLETLVSKLQHVRFEPAGTTGNPDIPTATSVVAYIYRFLGQLFLKDQKVAETFGDMLCPECGVPVVYEEGCSHCNGCGWSNCG